MTLAPTSLTQQNDAAQRLARLHLVESLRERVRELEKALAQKPSAPDPPGLSPGLAHTPAPAVPSSTFKVYDDEED